jgi:hypothetical protein
MKFSMTGQEKGDLLIQVTVWAGFSMRGQGLSFDTGDCRGRFFTFSLSESDFLMQV